jgi:hypothetical protein
MKFSELQTISGANYQRAHAGSEIAELGKTVGYHRFNRVDVYDAVAIVQQRCPDGYRAAWADKHKEVPADKTVYRVGLVRVHSGDPYYVLYIYDRR